MSFWSGRWTCRDDRAGTLRRPQPVCRAAAVRKIDPRVTKALELIRQSNASKIPLDDIASSVFLSPSRFAHLFSETVGLPFRRYVLWRKVCRALQVVSRGATLSSAAHRSGFSDSAHLTRTFYQMFGISPTVMLGAGELYEIPSPFEPPTVDAA